ncbi:MAG: cohesin domain-containing protein [Euryarchaeota archaeon]|nr:cohesin domain-containing protein [Euryarchaeota archaeon]
MIMKTEPISKKMLLFMPVVALIVFTTGAAAQEEENASVRVNAPEFISGTFDVTIDVHNVVNLYGGNFDLSFDPDVVNANGVYKGEIDGATVAIDNEDRYLMEDNRVRVLFNIDDVDNPHGVSGSGYLAMIRFEVVGGDGDTSALELSDGLLSCYESDDHPLLAGNRIIPPEINADWSGDVVTVGDAGTVKTEKIASTPVRTATPRSSTPSLDSGAGSVTASTPATEHAPDVAVPVGASERDEPDWWDVMVEHNFIGTYLFIGLLAFTYTLILLK